MNKNGKENNKGLQKHNCSLYKYGTILKYIAANDF